MSKLRDIVRQVKPVQESYRVDYVDKVQNLFEGRTTEATKMENVIVACWSNRNLKNAAFAK